MKSYDEIIGFDYTDENEWKNWIEEKFLPLHKQLSIILKLRENLENILRANLKEALTRQHIQEMLLGGVTEEGEYTSNSLAKLYKDILGISINPKEWIAYCRAGLDPAENGIECRFENTSFLTFISKMKELVEKALSRINVEPQDIGDEEIEEVINSPEKIVEAIRKIYSLIVSISANHDYHMFFVLNTRCIPRFFIEKAYPKLKEDLEKVVEILELEGKFVPNTNDEEVRRNYALIGHKENGLADALFNMQHTIWNYFDFSKEFYDSEKWKDALALAVIPTNLKEEFKKMVSKIVLPPVNISKNIILTPDKFDCKSCIEEFESQDTRHGYWYDRKIYQIRFTLKGCLIEKVSHGLSYRRSWSGRKGYTGRIHDEQIPLTTFLSNLSPLLFLGIVSLTIKENEISLNHLLG
ncbi:hypothetical protein DRP04_08660 [Archaeoglobales archaeon]|nr:MAG: hypothetical protein DRP04_08660 [Archaeoglobales archaeon]